MSLLVYKCWKQCTKCYKLTPKYISNQCKSCGLAWGIVKWSKLPVVDLTEGVILNHNRYKCGVK